MTRLLSFRTFYQIGFSILITASLIIQFVYGGVIAGFTTNYIVQFITYFTILSNILVATVLALEARAYLKHTPVSQRLQSARGLAVFCILTTGVIYTLFLRGPMPDSMQDSIPFINSVFHYIVPSVMVLDWIIFPIKTKVKWISILVWIGITAIYLFLVEVLGYFTGSYPYFFVDPVLLHGYLGVLRAGIAFIPFFAVFGGIVVLSNRIRVFFAKKA